MQKTIHEPWIRWHWQNLNEIGRNQCGSGFVEGRAWLHIGRPCLCLEWSFKRSGMFNAGITVGGCESDFGISLILFFCSFHLGLSDLFPYKWLPRDWGRDIGITLSEEYLFLSLWYDSSGWTKKKWWQSFSLDWKTVLLGELSYAERDIGQEEAAIPLPEGKYGARIRFFESTWKRSRLPWGSKMVRAEITVTEGIPITGKYGTRLDRSYSLIIPARTAAEAVGAFVKVILRDRERDGFDEMEALCLRAKPDVRALIYAGHNRSEFLEFEECEDATSRVPSV